MLCCRATAWLIAIAPFHRLAAGTAGGTDEDRGQHRRGRGQRHAALRQVAAGNVPLDDVAGLVRHDGGQLRFVVGQQDQSAVDADEAAEGREGVDHRLAQDRICKILALVVRLGGEPHARAAGCSR